MANIVITECSYAGEPGALAKVELDSDEPLSLRVVSALLGFHGADWVHLERVLAFRNHLCKKRQPLPGDRIACACPRLSGQVAVLAPGRSWRRHCRLEVVTRAEFERQWRESPQLAWRFLARLTER